MNRPGGDRRRPVGKNPPRERPRQEVVINGIAAGGEGVGRLQDGRAIFVHRTAPGERVLVQVVHERPRWARGRLIEVLEPSPDRREAPCPHYAECGGCTLEHLEYDAQLRTKSRIVADALARIGGIELDPPAVVPSPRQHRYRNRVSFALHRRGSGRVAAGFHALGDPDRIVPIDGSCLLPEESIGLVWDRLRANWGVDANRLPSGERLRLTLRSSAGGAVSLLIEGGYSQGKPEELVGLVEGLESVWHKPEARSATHVAGAPGLPEAWGEERFEVGGTAFLQVNREAAALLEEHVIATAGNVSGQHVIDAYCGIGLHARRLARLGAAVTGLELDGDAVRVADEAGTPGARYHQGRVEDLLEAALPGDLLILNPPRAGVDAAAIVPILNQPPQHIIYISCDPATLARDLKLLSSSFQLTSIRCFDLFPQTAHVETVVGLTRLATLPE